MRMKSSLLGSVAVGVIATALSTSAAYAGAMPAGYADDEGYTAGSYQPLPEQQYEDSSDIISFGIQDEPAPVEVAAEPEPEPEMPAPAPFSVALGNSMDALDSPCATGQTAEDNATLRSELDQVLASPSDEFSAGCGNGVNVADIDPDTEPRPPVGDSGGPSSLIGLGAISAGGAALTGGDTSEIDSVLSLSVGDPGDDAAANRTSLVEVTLGDNFLFGEDGQSDPINITLLDAINGDGSSAPEGGTSGTPLDALLDPVNNGTGEPGLLSLDLSGRPTSPADPNFDGLVEANVGDDEDPAGFNLVQVDALDDELTGGVAQISVGDGVLDEGPGTIADGDLGDNLIGVTLGPDPTGNENDNLVQATLDNAGFADLGTALGISSIEVLNPTELQNGTMEPATLAEINGDESGALAPLAEQFQFSDGTDTGGGETTGPTGTPLDAVLGPLADAAGGGDGGGETTGPTGTPLDAVLAPLADATASGGSGAPALPVALSPDQLAGLSGSNAELLSTDTLLLDPALLTGLLGGGDAGVDASLLDPVLGLLGLGATN